jgi:hypothetical protein
MSEKGEDRSKVKNRENYVYHSVRKRILTINGVTERPKK